MSWGFFLELDLTLPTTEWTRIAATRTGEHAISPTWWGFQEPELGTMFTAADFDDMPIGKAVELFDRAESIGQVTTDGDTTTLRLVQHLDRGGDPSIAKTIAALVEASKAVAQGRLRLVNDGTYSGESGVELTIEGGEISRTLVEDCWQHIETLGAEIYGGEIDE